MESLLGAAVIAKLMRIDSPSDGDNRSLETSEMASKSLWRISFLLKGVSIPCSDL